MMKKSIAEKGIFSFYIALMLLENEKLVYHNKVLTMGSKYLFRAFFITRIS